ncbi:hypothetical protein [Ekhidna sp.]|uniref:hypothetical protein n=1 Tax=Ekhidna sp. TaxID=2608089 RepID=UPI003CCBA727
MKKVSILLLLGVMVFTGCSKDDEAGPIIDIGITEDAVQLTNQRQFKVYYHLVDERFLGLKGVYPVGDDQPHLEARESIEIPFDEIQGYDVNDSERIMIHYWNSVVNDGEEKADEVRIVSIAISGQSL